MANSEHLAILKQGVKAWNEWRKKNPDTRPDLNKANLRRADLNDANLIKTDLSRVDLRGANLEWADLYRANLDEARLDGANLNGANLNQASFNGAHLDGANLEGVDLYKASLKGTHLNMANLNGADLVETDLERADLSGSTIYGISAWNVNLKDAIQTNLIITRSDEASVTVDDLEVAQFIYLLLNNQKLRNVIDTLTSKAVLILGRFTDKRKRVLDAIRQELRRRDYLPILFDFDPSANRDVTETVTLLARMSRFIIADLTDPRSIPQELDAIVPQLPSVPVQPILLSSQREYGMFEHFTHYSWVLPIYRYKSERALLASLGEKVIAPAEQKAKELMKK